MESPWPPDSKTGLTFSNGAILSPTVSKTKSVKESKISEGKYYFPSLILEALCTKESEIVEEIFFCFSTNIFGKLQTLQTAVTQYVQ